MLQVPSDLGHYLWKIPDRRSMVVLPFLDPAYISDVYGFSSDSATAQLLIFVLYAITMLSIYGGKLPTIIINKTGKNPYAARMQAMLIFAVFPLFALLHSHWVTFLIGSRLSSSVSQELPTSHGLLISIL